MNLETNGIPVNVRLTNEEHNRGTLEYLKTGPSIILDNSIELEDAKGVSFRFIESPSSEKILTAGLKPTDMIILEPIYCDVLGFSKEPLSQITMYPPSSNDWIAHVVETGESAVFTIQEIMDRDRFLLTISSIADNTILGSYLLHYYEIGILTMKRDWDIHRDLFFKQTPPLDMDEYLNRPPPSWSFVGSLVEDITIPNLQILKSMGETLSQLVPRSFPPSIRTQIIAFLSWLETAEIPDQDPIEFHSKYSSVDIFRSLVWGHLMCMLEGVEPPNYIRVLAMADKGRLSLTERPLQEPELQNPWYHARETLHSEFPDRMKRAIAFTQQLNNSGEIQSKLPVSMEMASESRESWGNRFAMVVQGLMMRGHVSKEKLGLRSMVYTGGAHRWPHRHTEFSARLGYQKEKPQQMQIMVFPITAIEKVNRLLPTIIPIGWEHSETNLSLYNIKKRHWSMNTSLIVKSLDRTRTLSQLRKEFDRHRSNNHTVISPVQAKVLDMVSWGLYLGSLETGLYSDYYGISQVDLEKNLSLLQESGIISIEYTLSLQKLTSISITAEGSPHNVHSFSRAMLKHAPSATIRISENETTSFIIARIPEDEAYNFITMIPPIGEEQGITLKILPISAYISYRNNLYRRLLKNDGTWHDDVSGLLSQVRLRSKHDD